jgi:hypothetical protein
MKYHEVINGPNVELWKEEVAKKHKRMIDSRVFEPVKMSKVPKGVKLIATTWAMKKERSGTLCRRVNVRGFKQIDGQHYDGTSISAPVTNAMTIRIALSIMGQTMLFCTISNDCMAPYWGPRGAYVMS